MRGDSKLCWRWIGGLALATAIVLLIVAETVLKGSLSSLSVLLVYLLCAVLTGAAVVIAVLDARTVAQKTLQEQRQLLDDTLREIGRDRGTSKSVAAPKPGPTTHA